MTIQATLQERVNLVASVGGDDVYFSVPTVSQTIVPNGLKIMPLEEVYINCDISDGGLNLYLPAISTFGNFWNAKIYIALTAGAVGIGNTVTIFPYPGSEDPIILADTLNGNTSLVYTGTFETYYLHIVAPNMWMALNCPPPALVPPIV